ncbi:MAG: ABC transporter permease [Candidatus Hermodarchaeota archaeon]
MKQEVSLQELKGELEGEEEESASRSVFKWFFNNIKFLLIPASRLEELTIREREYDKTVSKRSFLKRLKSVLTILGIVIVLYVVTLAIFGAWISPYTFQEADAVYNAPLFWAEPSPAHPLGNTYMGRDVYARMIYGARASLTMALPAIGLSLICGIFFGILAGYVGGWLDSIIMRVFDILLAFPALIFAIVFVSIFGRSLSIIIMAYGVLGIPYYSRLIRGNVLQAKELPYVQAARVSGAKTWRIMFRHILPNTIQPIIISVTLDIGGVILSFAGLAFLGYSDPDLIEWGRDISDARGHILDAPWASLFPGLMIVITVLGFMLLGDGLRDALDPRLKNL